MDLKGPIFKKEPYISTFDLRFPILVIHCVSGKGLQVIGLLLALNVFEYVGSLLCHICCGTGHRFCILVRKLIFSHLVPAERQAKTSDDLL